MTDVHFNYVNPASFKKFLKKLAKKNSDAFFLTGDISNSENLIAHLVDLEDAVRRPIYFVLGNHDLWGNSIAAVHSKLSVVCNQNPNLIWLTDRDLIQSSPGVAIVGHDGWYDAKLGWNFYESLVFKWDWHYIRDFKILKHDADRWIFTQQLAQHATQCIKVKLLKAFETHHTVHLLTHVPPWPEPKNVFTRIFENFWLPYNVCKTMGDMLDELMTSHPDKRLYVYSGHTHNHSTTLRGTNTVFNVGRAMYGLLQEDSQLII